jgi:plasmid stabilization system protein ParE
VLTIEVTPRALAQLERAARWWALNRPAAPGAIAADFDAATRLLAFEPGVGARCGSDRRPDLRRLHLERVRYHIYYITRAGRLVVLAFWHSARGTGPKL